VTTLSATTRAEASHNLPMRYLVCCDKVVEDGRIAICLPHKYDKDRRIVILFTLQGDITWRGVQRWYGSTSINPKLLPVGGLHASTSGYVDLTSGLQNIGGDALQSIMARRMDPAMKVNETAPSNQVKVQTCREAAVARDRGVGKDQRMSTADRVVARLEQPKTRQDVTSGVVEFFRHTLGNGPRLSGEPCAPIVRYSRRGRL